MRLYTTIVRFDAVYVQHFKCNLRDIRSGYPALHKWVRKLYWDVPAFGSTTQFEHIKRHYTRSHKQINPFVSRLLFLPCYFFPPSGWWECGCDGPGPKFGRDIKKADRVLEHHASGPRAADPAEGRGGARRIGSRRRCGTAGAGHRGPRRIAGWLSCK